MPHTQTEIMNELTKLPNIGKEMASCMICAGITSRGQLEKLGSISAAVSIAPFRKDKLMCRSAVSALEGAIRQVRWHNISKSERDKLWNEYLAAIDK